MNSITNSELAAALRADADEWEMKAGGTARYLSDKEIKKIAGIVTRLRAAAEQLSPPVEPV